ncbi:hypothetical protein PR048_013575 [Dryococelus australis]|uniref:Uncharacterized protein n=1 Tax=Dryococelus australis TaxID=614101 RepID=A0ABQ9HSV6_9NEOP|nr:hypothetical protein PR048_013575 [Dryococelus australis]
MGRENYNNWNFAKKKLLQTAEARAFEDSGLTRKEWLLRTFVTTQLDNCIYCDTIITAAYKINDTGFNVNEKCIGILLLAGLSDEHKPITTLVRHGSK